MDSRARAFWDEYLATRARHDPARSCRVLAESFGDTTELADTLGALIVRGEKTATCSAVWEWEAEGAPLPSRGVHQIVLDGRGDPLCIIEVTEVNVVPFRDVDACFAAAEGEGDRSLQQWRDGHWRYFERTLPHIGRSPREEMPLVCERFRVVHPPALLRHTLATAADIPVLLDLMAEFYAESAFTLNRGRAAGVFAALLGDERNGFAMLLRDEDGSLGGYLVVTFGFSMEFAGRDATLDDMYVVPSARGRGIGRRALAAMRAECVMRGARAIHVEAAHDNDAALAAYRGIGFVPTRRAHLTLPLAQPAHDEGPLQ